MSVLSKDVCMATVACLCVCLSVVLNMNIAGSYCLSVCRLLCVGMVRRV